MHKHSVTIRHKLFINLYEVLHNISRYFPDVLKMHVLAKQNYYLRLRTPAMHQICFAHVSDKNKTFAYISSLIGKWRQQHGDGDERTDHQARQSICSWIGLHCNRCNICSQNVVNLQSFLRSCLRTISLISDKSR